MSTRDVVTVATDAGMLALWRGSAFPNIDSYDDWERQVNERLPEAIAHGALVPVGIQGDGAFGVRIAVAPDGATERESQYTVVTSDPYLLISDGGAIQLTGVEAVGDQESSPLTVTLPEGRYAVRAVLVAWDEAPGAFTADGEPGPDVLPDFLVLIAQSDGSETFRTSEATFNPPE